MDVLALSGSQVANGAMDGTVALLPMGAIEYHGPHGPLGTDAYIARGLARRISEAIPKLLILPDFSYTHCPVETRGYAGSISVEADVVRRSVSQMLTGLFRAGVKAVVVVNAHNGNIAPVQIAADQVASAYPDRILALVNWWETLPADLAAHLSGFTQNGGHGHGGPVEMSVAKALVPDLIDATAGTDLDVVEWSRGETMRLLSDPHGIIPWEGYHGLVSEIDQVAGERLLATAVDRIVDAIEELFQFLDGRKH